ncbi:MAG: hypothetical protein P4L92_08085 [Rudaea sp.]|nr:hypothetical protein [Rudaea sp.]
MSFIDKLGTTKFGKASIAAHYGFSRRAASVQILKHLFLEQLKKESRYQDKKRLHLHEHQAFSQNGEDGIIREIFRRIGAGNKTFIEIGVGDGLENNTVFLLYDGWRGLWVEGNAANCKKIKRHFTQQLQSGQIALSNTLVTMENVDNIVASNRPQKEVDLLSIDVDRNTFYIWKALGNLKPRVIVVEYNALFPADMAWAVEYSAEKWWRGSTYFGASLKAFENLGRNFGYSLVGCDLSGTNAFFVRADLCDDSFCEPFTAENHYEPDRDFLHGKSKRPRSLHD